jgi:hypothetical protein
MGGGSLALIYKIIHIINIALKFDVRIFQLETNFGNVWMKVSWCS